MRQISRVGLIASTVALLVTAFAPTATAADERQTIIEFNNQNYGECLVHNPDQSVVVGPCDGSAATLWQVTFDYQTQIRSVVTGECLDSIDTSNAWDDVTMSPCTDSARQLWQISFADGLIENAATGMYLKANHYRVIYAGDLEHYYPFWEIN